MKITFTLAITFFCCLQLFGQSHVGVWILEKFIVKDSKNNIVEEYTLKDGDRMIKVFSPTHFIRIAQKKILQILKKPFQTCCRGSLSIAGK